MDFARHVKSSVEIVSVVGETVRLRKQGPNRYTGLCPFHNEKTPSFSVHQGLQIFKCFGCGKGGDVFNFVMEMQGLTFYEALQSLAEGHGIPMPARRSGELGEAESRLREKLLRIHELAQELFQKQLGEPAGAATRAYLEKRGLEPEVWKRFGLGYAAGKGARLLTVLKQAGVSAGEAEAAGLIAKRDEGPGYYDRFRDRLMFPIHNERGKIIAFGGRALSQEQKAKYLNSPETEIYKKQSVLYNLHRAREPMRAGRRVVLVEGYMDVIAVERAGVANVVASCGTSLTPAHARLIHRHAGTVIVNFDPDPAGQKAVERSIEILMREGVRVRVLRLPEGLDPDDFCKRHGAETYGKKLDEAPGYHDWLADQARSRFDMRTTEGRVAAIQLLDTAIRLLSDPIERADIAERVGRRMGLDRVTIERFRLSLVKRRSKMPPVEEHSLLSKAEVILARLFVESEPAREELLGAVIDVATRQELPALPIFQAIAAAAEQETAFQYSALEGRLDEPARRELEKLLFASDSRPCQIEEGRHALEALRRRDWEKQYRTMLRKITEAEQSGGHDQALMLLREKKNLESAGHEAGWVKLGRRDEHRSAAAAGSK